MTLNDIELTSIELYLLEDDIALLQQTCLGTQNALKPALKLMIVYLRGSVKLSQCDRLFNYYLLRIGAVTRISRDKA